jgi:IS30 family transposase
MKRAKGKQLSDDLKAAIVNMSKKDMSVRNIANFIGKSPSTVEYVLKRYKTRGTVKNSKRTGEGL